MTGNEVKKLVTMLKLAFPRQEVTDETARVYAQFLVDLDWTVAEPAVAKLLRTARFFPTIAEVREVVAEASLGAPGDATAWAQVNAVANHRPEWNVCPVCMVTTKDGTETFGTGYVDVDAEIVCAECKGTGRADATAKPYMHPLVRQALDVCGGVAAIRAADKAAVVRAQFRDTYREVRADAVRAVQTGEVPALPASPREKLAAGNVPALEMRSMA